MRVEALAMLLLSYHEPSAKSVGKEKKSLCSCHLEKIERYIEQNYHHRVAIDEICGELHLSRGYLRNIFHEFRGKSPRDYLIEVQINRAKELLSLKYDGWNASVSIATVAASVGHEDALRFSKFFKKAHGSFAIGI